MTTVRKRRNDKYEHNPIWHGSCLYIDERGKGRGLPYRAETINHTHMEV